MFTVLLVSVVLVVSVVSVSINVVSEKEFTMWTVIKSVVEAVVVGCYVVMFAIVEETMLGSVLYVPIVASIVFIAYVMIQLNKEQNRVLVASVFVACMVYVVWVCISVMGAAINDTSDFAYTITAVVGSSVLASVAGSMAIAIMFYIVKAIQGMGGDMGMYTDISYMGMCTDISDMGMCTDISTMGDSCQWFSGIAFKLSFQEGAKKQDMWNTVTSRALYSDIEYNEYNGYTVHNAYTLMADEEDVYGDMQEDMIQSAISNHMTIVKAKSLKARSRQGRNDKNSK